MQLQLDEKEQQRLDAEAKMEKVRMCEHLFLGLYRAKQSYRTLPSFW
jgi:hypothetical protein